MAAQVAANANGKTGDKGKVEIVLRGRKLLYLELLPCGGDINKSTSDRDSNLSVIIIQNIIVSKIEYDAMPIRNSFRLFINVT